MIIPNHRHGISIITNPHVGAGFDINQTHLTDHQSAKPALTPQTNPSHLSLNAIVSPIDAATPMTDRGMNPDPANARAGFGVKLTMGMDSPVDDATPMGDRGMNPDPANARAGFGVRLTAGIDSPVDAATLMADRGMNPDPANARAGFGVRLTAGIDSFSAKPAPTINDIQFLTLYGVSKHSRLDKLINSAKLQETQFGNAIITNTSLGIFCSSFK